MVALSRVDRRLDLGRVVRGTFALIGRNAAVFAVMAMLVAATPYAIVRLTVLPWVLRVSGYPASTAFALAVNLAVTVFSGNLLTAAMLESASPENECRRVSLPASFAALLRSLPSILALSALTTIGLACGFALAFVPGVILLLVWRVASAAQLVERTSVIGAFQRSAALTRRHRGLLFALLVGLGLLDYAIMMATVAIVGLTLKAVLDGTSFTRVGTIGTLYPLLIESLGYAAGMTVLRANALVLYWELRSIRGGMAPGAAAAVFD